MKKILILMLAATFNFYAQSEFQVNTFQDSVQRAPVIAQKGDGSYLIVWQSINEVESNSKFDIFSQWFDSNDQKFEERLPVNLIYENDQERPAVAMNDAGSYVIVWATHSGTEQDIFDIKGYAHTENLTSRLDVNTTTIHTQTKPDVAIDQDGNFIVVWESWYQDGSNKGIYGQRYNSELIKVGSEFLINTTTLYSQANPVVEYLENGNFVVVWESWKQDIITPSGYGLYGKIFDSDANVVAEEFSVNTYTNDYQWFGDIASLI
jgi:predicted  nucleic acid-binding Zn-ribbon protein